MVLLDDFPIRTSNHVGIPMGTNCTPLVAAVFLNSKESDFVQHLQKKRKTSISLTFRYIDDVLSLNNPTFNEYSDVNYEDGKLFTRLYDKRDDFVYPIVNFPYISILE